MALIDLGAVAGVSKELGINLLHTRSQVVTIASSSTNAAGADVALDLMYVENEWILGVALFNALTAGNVNSITGASQLAWTDTPGAKKARVRRTDANAGVCLVDVEICEV